jgi:hypothetical protein
MIPGLLVVEVALLVDSVACFAGRWIALPVGVALSVLTIGLVVFQWNSLGMVYSAGSILLSVIALVLSGVAMVSRVDIPEESHPLNLPVFG